MTKKRKAYTGEERAAYSAYKSLTRTAKKSGSGTRRSPLRTSATSAAIAAKLSRDEAALAKFYANVNARMAREKRLKEASGSVTRRSRTATASAATAPTAATAAPTVALLNAISESPELNMLKASIEEEGIPLTKNTKWGNWAELVNKKRANRLNAEQKAAAERFRLLPYKRKQIIYRQLERKAAAEAAAAVAAKKAEENALLNAAIKEATTTTATKATKSKQAWPSLPVRKSELSLPVRKSGPIASAPHILAAMEEKQYTTLWLGGLPKSIKEKGIERKLKDVFPDYDFKEKGSYDLRYLKENGIKLRRDEKGSVIGFGYVHFTSMAQAKKAYEAFKNKLQFFEKVTKEDGTFEKVYYKVLVEPAIGQYAEK